MKLPRQYMGLLISNVVAKQRICENSNYSCVWLYTAIYFHTVYETVCFIHRHLSCFIWLLCVIDYYLHIVSISANML